MPATATEPRLPSKEELERYIKTNEARLEMGRKVAKAKSYCDLIEDQVEAWVQHQKQLNNGKTAYQRDGFVLAEYVAGKKQLSYKDICVARLGAAEVARLAEAQPDVTKVRITRSHS